MKPRWSSALLGVALVAGSFFTACAPSVGEGGAWENWDQIEGTLRPETSPTPQTPAPTDVQALRVVTFNVHHGENVDGIVQAFHDNEALAKADLVSVQEIQSYPSEEGSRASKIASRLGMAYVYAPARTFNNGTEDGTHGNAILSRYPLSNIQVMTLPHGKLVIDEERRIAVTADVEVGAKSVHFIAVHLDTRLNPAERVLQLRPAVKDAPDPVIVAGDFNTNPMAWAFDMAPVLPLAAADSDQAPVLDDYMRSINYQTPTASFGPTVSFPGLEPRLDSIYVRGLAVGSGAVERSVTVSDHWPMWLDVAL